jgi:8-hydroxy-5-deazaflavin:NADPH oxidoreductase
MKIAVIGTGHIGGTLGAKWQAAGHEVTYGSRQAEGQAGGEGQTGPGGAPLRAIGDALAGAEVVVFAVPGGAVAEVAAGHGKALGGKVVVDATNRMGADRADNLDTITGAAPDAKYVRAFNIYGWENFADPQPGTTLFFAADPAARAVTEELVRAVGLEPAYVGGTDATATVNGVAALWFALMRERGERRLALKLLA